MENETELIRQQMLETRSALSEKLEALQEQVLSTVEDTTRTVTQTVQTVQEAVQDTVSTVSDSVQGTVETVKETFDLRRQVQSHPWLLLGGAVAAGYIGGRLLNRSEAHAVARHPSAFQPASSMATSRPAEPNWLDNLVGPMLKQAQDLAVAALAGVATDLVNQHAPEPLREKLNEVANNITSALGTKPIHGLLSEDFFNGKHS